MRILDFSDGFESASAPTIVAIPASSITNTPSGNLSATTQQAANNELQGDIDTLNAKIGAPSGIASLDSGGKIPSSQIPALALVDVYTVADIAARDALTVQEGDVAVVTDAGAGVSKTYIYDGSSWIELLADGSLAAHVASTAAHGATGAVVGTTNTQTLTNKTLTAPTITTPTVDVTSWDDQGSTPSTPASGVYKTYFKTDGKFYKLSPAGVEEEIGTGAGGSGGIDYITNGKATTDTSGWSTYADAAGTLPVDGTGGSPSVTWSRSTTTPLRGVADFNLVKGATNRQGDGVSYDFTIDSADKAKVLTIAFDYEVVSGTYADNDMIAYIYDVTNSTLIQPAGFQIKNVVGSIRQTCTFQSASNSTSYRLIFHVSSTSASAYTLALDNISVGPQAITQGTPVSDWTAYTPTLTNFSASAVSFFWKRVGDTLHVKGKATVSSVSGAMQVSIPSGLSVDTTKLGAANLINGIVLVEDVGVGFHSGVTEYQGTNIGFLDDDGGSRYAATTPMTWASGDFLSFEASYPIAGWSSNVQMSSDTDTRVVAMVAQQSSPSASVASGHTLVTFSSAPSLDTHAGYNTSTGLYTVRVPGVYRLAGSLIVAGTYSVNQYLALGVLKNGSLTTSVGVITAASLSSQGSTISTLVSCVAGDTLGLSVACNATTPTIASNANSNWLQIERISGPSQIAASESINAKYTTAAAQAVTNGSTTIIDFGTKVWDSHGSVTTGASWKFTAPVAGKYRVGFSVLAQAAAGTFQFNLAKNGSTYSELYRNLTSNQNLWTGVDTIDLLAGEYCDVRLNNGSGGTITLNANAQECRITIEKVG